MTEWKSIENEQPRPAMIIVYSTGNEIESCVGRYLGGENPMPSAPQWLQWDRVRFWMELPTCPKSKETPRVVKIKKNSRKVKG